MFIYLIDYYIMLIIFDSFFYKWMSPKYADACTLNYMQIVICLSFKCPLPAPSSVVPKPEVQHSVPWRNCWSKPGRQAGATESIQQNHMVIVE